MTQLSNSNATPKDPTTRHEWKKDDPKFRFPGSGLLLEISGDLVRGALGFQPHGEECEIVVQSTSADVGWPSLIEKVTAQARKARYPAALLAVSDLPRCLEQALRDAGFEGSPLRRRLVYDAPSDLQPYLDWKGRVVQFAAGKGSESVKGRLYVHLANLLPCQGSYSETPMNAILKELIVDVDHVALRRELVDPGYLARTRDCRAYWKTGESYPCP